MTEVCHAWNANDLRSAIIAACAMLLTFAAVAVPVPLYAENKIALVRSPMRSVAGCSWPPLCYSAR